MNSRFRTARSRERCAIEGLVGRQPWRRRALWVERVATLIVVIACVAAIVGGVFTARAVQRASGRQDQRVMAVTSSRPRLYPNDRTAAATWVADVTWTDRAGHPHSGRAAVRPDARVGTRVPARLGADGVVRSRPESVLDVVCQVAAAWLGIGVLLLAFSLISFQAFGRLAERMRRESWRVAWNQWHPAAPNREEL
jgi:hypothetical protein